MWLKPKLSFLMIWLTKLNSLSLKYCLEISKVKIIMSKYRRKWTYKRSWLIKWVTCSFYRNGTNRWTEKKQESWFKATLIYWNNISTCTTILESPEIKNLWSKFLLPPKSDTFHHKNLNHTKFTLNNHNPEPIKINNYQKAIKKPLKSVPISMATNSKINLRFK